MEGANQTLHTGDDDKLLEYVRSSHGVVIEDVNVHGCMLIIVRSEM